MNIEYCNYLANYEKMKSKEIKKHVIVLKFRAAYQCDANLLINSELLTYTGKLSNSHGT